MATSFNSRFFLFFSGVRARFNLAFFYMRRALRKMLRAGEDLLDLTHCNTLQHTGTKFRKMLRAGEDIPEWFAFKSVVKVLREA